MSAAVVAATAFGLWWTGACSDQIVDPPPPLVADRLIVSDAVPTVRLSALGGLATPRAGAVDEAVGYVSLRPGAVPAGARAFIRRVGDATFVTTALRDGGFDPIAVPAAEGDTIDVRVTDTGGGTLLHQRVMVLAARPPVVVRTQPPRKKVDVPLNSAIIVYFSEPVDASVLAGGAIQLWRATSVVSGSVRFLESDQLSVEFVPASPLAAGTDYQLLVTNQVRDLSGDALAAPDTVPFRTGTGVVGQPASLTLSPDSIGDLMTTLSYDLYATVRDGAGSVLVGQPVTWSSSDAGVAPVSSADSGSLVRGRVRGVSPGTVTITATSGNVSATATVTVAPVPPTGIAALTLSPDTLRVPAWDGGLLTLHIWDGSGQEITDNPPSPPGRFVVTVSFGNPTVFPEAPRTFTSSDCGWGEAVGRIVYIMCAGWNTIRVGSRVEGVSTVIVTSEGVSDTAVVIVGPPRAVAEVRVVPAFWTFSGDSVTTLTVYLLDSAGAGITGGAHPISWTADPSAVATIDTTRGCTVESRPPGSPESARLWCVVRGADTGSATVAVSSGGHADTVAISVLPKLAFSSVTAGSYADYAVLNGHSCGVTIGGPVVCWGGDRGAIGDEWRHYAGAPWALVGDLAFDSLSAARAYTCGLTAPGAAYCWGSSIYFDEWYDYWILGATDAPQAIPGGHRFVSVDAGGETTCGLTPAGTALCWTYWGTPNPVPVSDTLTFTALSVGEAHACALDASGAAYCWGSNANGQLGDSSTNSSSVPVSVRGGLSFVSLTAGTAHTCGLLASGDAYCWGRNQSGELGDGTTSERHAPTLVSGGLSFMALSRGSAAATTCGLTADGTTYCWGDNQWGQVGDGSTTNRAAPVEVAGGLRFSSVSNADRHTCAVTTTAVAYCWGWNGAGQLGDGTLRNSLVPVKVAGQP